MKDLEDLVIADFEMAYDIINERPELKALIIARIVKKWTDDWMDTERLESIFDRWSERTEGRGSNHAVSVQLPRHRLHKRRS